MDKRILFCWELGAGKGHVLPYLSLLERLRARGYEITVAVRDTAEVGEPVLQRGFTLMQAPVCMQQFSGVDKVSYTNTEVLLHFGYGHAQTLKGLFAAWRTLIERVAPSLVIGNCAPSALLIARKLDVKTVKLGSGFDCTPATDPSALLRAWAPGIDERIRGSDAIVLETVNAVLRANGWSSLSSIAELYRDDATLLCTFPELDHFGVRPGAEEYLGLLPGPADGFDSADSGEQQCEIFAYLRPGVHFDPLIAALRKLGRRTLAHCPNLSATDRARLETATLRFADKPVDIPRVLGHCKLVVGSATQGVTSAALCAGKPLLLLPSHQEQTLLAQCVTDLGAGIAVGPAVQHPKFSRLLASLLEDRKFTEAAEAFSKRHAQSTPEHAVNIALERCLALLEPVQAHDRRLAIAV
jgi:hypothetical protein